MPHIIPVHVSRVRGLPNATERLDVAMLLCCGHNSRCAVSEVVLEQVDRSQCPVEIRKRVCDGPGTAIPNLVPSEIETGQ